MQKAKALSFFLCLIVLEKLKYSFLITLKLSVINIITPSVIWNATNWSETMKNNMHWCKIYFDMQKFTQMTRRRYALQFAHRHACWNRWNNGKIGIGSMKIFLQRSQQNKLHFKTDAYSIQNGTNRKFSSVNWDGHFRVTEWER